MANARQLMAARSAWSGGKRDYTARDYAQDGLVAMWDGIENAGWGVHRDSVDVWYDLAGKYPMTMHRGGSVHSDHMYCNGDGCIAYRNGDYIPMNQARTIECVCRFDNLGEGRTAFNISPEETSNYLTRTFFYGIHGRIYASAQRAGTAQSNPYSVPAEQKTISLSASYKTGIGSLSFRKNLTNGVDSYTTGAAITTKTGMTIGGRNSILTSTAATPFVGAIFNLRVYDRILSEEEIAANYEIDKARFNLP